MAKIKASELREKGKEELKKQLDELRTELASLRVSKVSGQGGPSRLAKMKIVRKGIARVLTVINQNAKDELRKAYKKSKWQPLDLRRKATRAIRRRLTVKEATAKTLRTKKRMSYFPIRKYAVKA